MQMGAGASDAIHIHHVHVALGNYNNISAGGLSLSFFTGPANHFIVHSKLLTLLCTANYLLYCAHVACSVHLLWNFFLAGPTGFHWISFLSCFFIFV